MERLDKVLSSQGICSRKEARSLAAKQRIKVNGEVIKKSDVKIDPEKDTIEVDGTAVEYRRYLYIMMNKPSGVLSASTDKKAQTVIDLLPPELRRSGLFPAGRLDKDTTGLLIITDDGDFAHNMLSPKNKVYKLYCAKLDGELEENKIKILESGITLKDGTCFKPARISLPNPNDRTIAEIEICEGKYHQVKRMFQSVGLTVIQLKRLRIGGLCLDKELFEGKSRILAPFEVKDIFNGKYD
ncbi:MAG: rRNA pseudouridine synthase [Lachnospiraceae bacterium]|nr:rRNA pseudouridine synthase [Lachnospiraceae bacterium]